LTPEEIRRIREESRTSQAVFAALLNISVSTVHKWATGQKRPTGAALKLLHLAQKRGVGILVA
jgi:putative transcriptional regulator